jgi:hypothetical protein
MFLARRKKSKSDAIRAALAELGAEARNRDIIAHLAEKKVKVNAPMVSTVRARASGAVEAMAHGVLVDQDVHAERQHVAGSPAQCEATRH